MSLNLSEDSQYLMLTEKKLISLKIIDLLAHEDERVRQAYHISCIFNRYIDHAQRIHLVEELKELLTLRGGLSTGILLDETLELLDGQRPIALAV